MKLQIIYALQSLLFTIYLVFQGPEFQIIVAALSLVIQVLLLKWTKYLTVGMELAQILLTLPMGFMMSSSAMLVLVMQCTMVNSYMLCIRLSYIVVVSSIIDGDTQLIICTALALVLLIFMRYIKIMEHTLTDQSTQDKAVIKASPRSAQWILNHSLEYKPIPITHHMSLSQKQSHLGVKDQFLQMMDEFPEGVALIQFDSEMRPFVDFCNQSIKVLAKADDMHLLEALSNMENLVKVKQKTQATQKEMEMQSSLLTYNSNHLNKDGFKLGAIRKQYRAATQPARYTNGYGGKTPLIQEQKNVILQQYQIFNLVMEQATFQVHSSDVQQFLKKAKVSFDLHSIMNAYTMNNGMRVCVEIKLFISYLNSVPQILILMRDVSHRDHIKLLHKCAKAKSDAINYVSHEFRTPLSCIIQLLENQDYQSDVIRIAIQNCYYLLNFSKDLMDLAQIKVGKFKLSKSVFNLQTLILSCFDLFKIQSLKKQIQLTMNYPDSIPRNLYSDETRIKQVLINLIGNAFKFTLQGSIIIEVAQLIKYKSVQIKCIDTGLGIREQDRKRLMTAFGKIDNDESSKLNPDGVGLGLLISNEITKTLNWRKKGLEITSQIGKGSNFMFDIDYELSDSLHCSQEIKENLHESESDVSLNLELPSPPVIQKVYSAVQSKLKDVLLIDDNQFNIDSLARMLQIQGIHQVDFAISCEHALDIVRLQLETNTSYKLIILDIEMPLQDGFVTYNKLKHVFNSSMFVFPPVVGCSGYSRQSMQKEVLDVGMIEYMEKPLKRDDVKYLIEKYL